ncbi:DUF3987 domain-containing protein [Scytonema sp. PCC 10023]|uniref:DUF3987 domain-containing protein n=1 Tax=Scytonema sp. PCC 10023 TaxID=1680591 RepID=UPI0039C7444C
MTIQFSSFEIDTSQAIRQLELLGYHRGDAVYVRAFLPKEDLRYAPNTGRKADKLKFKQILHWQQQGYGIYFVINGGGHKDEDVQLCRAVFIEHDDLEIALQRDLWQTLSLPEPTFQVQTRKSVHSYWVFEKPIPVQEWKQLQTDLLTYTGADGAIKNPSRVMRLAGAWHIKPGEKPLRCNIISQSGLRYTYEELRSCVPVQQHPKLIESQVEAVQLLAQVSPQEQQYTRYQDISVPVPVAVPLEVCLSKESRALLNFGVNKGVRNTNGAKLARDLIGTANHLTTIGQRFDGDSQQLLQDYANRCTPPLPVKEVDAIWKSAEKDRPGPSCTPSGVETCIRAWYWNTYIKFNQNSLASSGNPSGSPGFSNVSSVGKKPPVSDVALPESPTKTLRERILQILGSYNSQSMRAIALMDLAALVGLPYRQIEQLAKLLTDEVDLQTDTLVATQKLSSLLKTCPQQLDLTRLLEPQFARRLIDTANAMPTAPEFLFTTLLATAASVVGSAARVIVKPSGKYTQPLVMWTSIVAESGSVKTPAQRVIIDPLVQLEAEAYDRYQIEAAEYNKLQTRRKGKKQDEDSQEEPPTSPVRQRYLTKDSTLETLQRIHSENPRGLLYYRDELAGLFKARNQYRGGLGADEEQELDQFNGSAIIYDRSEKSVCLPKSAISRTGSIQWEVLAAMMGDHNDYNGNFARWLFCAAKSPKRYLRLVGENTAPDTGISEALRQLYIKLASVPEQDYFLDTEAAVFFEAWQHSLVDAQAGEESYGLRVVYAKIEAYTARLALWLHIVNTVLRGETPSQVISGDTMEKAIELAAYFLWQHKLIHAQNSPESGLMSWGLKIQKVAERLGGATASMLKSGIRAFRKKPTFEIRRLMEMMAAAGWGRIEDKGSNLVYVPNGAPPSGIDKFDRDLTLVSIAQTSTNTAFDNRIDSVDTIMAASLSSEQLTSCHLNSSLGAEDVESCQFVNSTPQMPTATGTDSIDTFVQSGCQLSTDELSNIELTGDRLSERHCAPRAHDEADRSNDNAPHLVESGSVPTLLPLDGDSALLAEGLPQEKTGFSEVCQEGGSPGKFSPLHVTDARAGAASSLGEAYPKDSSRRGDGESAPEYFLQASTQTVAAMTADSALPDATPQTEQDVNATAIASNLNNRKLQPVEVLTAAGEWIRGYFIDACVRIANLVGVSQQFTLFNTDGTRYTFVGQIRPAPSS